MAVVSDVNLTDLHNLMCRTVWWDTTHGYKNAITNHLYVRTSAEGYLRFGNKTYLENAKKVGSVHLQSFQTNTLLTCNLNCC